MSQTILSRGLDGRLMRVPVIEPSRQSKGPVPLWVRVTTPAGDADLVLDLYRPGDPTPAVSPDGVPYMIAHPFPMVVYDGKGGFDSLKGVPGALQVMAEHMGWSSWQVLPSAPH